MNMAPTPKVRQTVRLLHPFFFLIPLVAAQSGCESKEGDSVSKNPDSNQMQFPDPSTGVVGFQIEESASEGTRKTWLAWHERSGKKAVFKITLFMKEPNGQRFVFTDGSFSHEKKSDASILLADLKTALQAKLVPADPRRVRIMKFRAVILGTQLSRSSRGGVAGAFQREPRGDWISTKLFLAEGEGEVFLSLNPSKGIAEFSIKDADYGDVVLSELAKVL